MLIVDNINHAAPKSDLLADRPIDKRFVASGFPAASDDYQERGLNLHELLVHNATATFFMRAGNNENASNGIYQGDLLVIDRSLPPVDGKLAIVEVDGELCIRRLPKKGCQGTDIYTPNPNINNNISHDSTVLWGMIAYVIHPMMAQSTGSKKAKK
jgi:DNA polymerase V